MSAPRARVAVVGAGAWGTAFAAHLATGARSAPAVTLYARTAAEADSLAAARTNARYLPGFALPAALAFGHALAEAARADVVVVATPTAELVPVADALLRAGCRAPLAWLCKGFINTPGGLPALAHQALAPRWPAPVGVLSGPTFAEEVARGLPAAAAVAATDAAFTAALAELVRGDRFRVYESDDLPGVEAAGALKNVLAIAAGASDALGFGHNARAALITRGLAESGRLAEALGGQRATSMGLAGLGDLVLTCTGDLSRNRRVGMALAEGRALDAILAGLGHVAEGVFAATAARTLAVHHRVELPICDAVYRVLYERVPVRDAVGELMRREPGRADAR
ncbi:MAG: NAD(P)-dependent glycerol-3-phosphate dehydrogenase [Proteobacteria bacterium]|nr:NAD(P)-dependent glycerol-3-phosphate dehydrogenase [Pseudomonadota bacterium]